MDQDSDPEVQQPSVEKNLPKVKALIRLLETRPLKPGKWKSASNLVPPAAVDGEKGPSLSHGERSISHNNTSNNVDIFPDIHISRSKTLRNEKRDIRLDKNAIGTPFNLKTIDNSNDLNKISENNDKSKNAMQRNPLPRSKTTGNKPRPKSLYFSKNKPQYYRELSENIYSRSPDDTDDSLTFLPESLQNSSPPPLPPRSNVAKEKPLNIPLSSKEVKPHGGAIRPPEPPPRPRTFKNLPKDQSTNTQSSSSKHLLKNQDKYPDLPKLPPRYIKDPNVTSKSSLQRSQTTAEKFAIHDSPNLKTKSPSKSSLHASKSTAQDFPREKSSDLEVVDKLQQIKTMFASTSAGKSEKYNKSLLLLIDIMAEAIQESSSQAEESDSEVEYCAMKDYVKNETKEYMKQNHAQNKNIDVEYETIFNQMVPKFLETYGDEESDEDNYSEHNVEIDENISAELNSPEKIVQIVDEIKNTENTYLENLKHLIDKYQQPEDVLPSERSFSAQMISVLERLYTDQSNFRQTIEACGENLSGILNIFLEYEQLFVSYILFFRKKTERFATSASNNNEFDELRELSELLLNRLMKYKLLIEDITNELDYDTKDVEIAKTIIDMLEMTLDRCNDNVATSSISNNDATSSTSNSVATSSVSKRSFRSVSKNGTVSLIDQSAGADKARFLAEAIPTRSYNWSEYGKFLLRDNFKVDNRKNYFTVFLFEKVMVLTKEVKKEEFLYKNMLYMNRLILLPPSKNKKEIKLQDYVKRKSHQKDDIIKLEAKSKEIQIKWRFAIGECLWSQLEQEKQESKGNIIEVSF